MTDVKSSAGRLLLQGAEASHLLFALSVLENELSFEGKELDTHELAKEKLKRFLRKLEQSVANFETHRSGAA
jgi:hypothetical protein